MKKNIIKYAVCLALPLGGVGGELHAQPKWSYEDCVQYAIEHNIDVQRRMLDVQMSENDLDTATKDWLPTVTAGIAQQFSFGNALASTGTMPSSSGQVDSDLSYTSAGVSAEMTLFDGFRTQNRVKAARWQVRQTMASLDHARKDLSIQVAVYYLQALYEEGMAKVAETQVETSRQLYQRTKALVDDGKNPKSDLADAEAQLAADEYDLTECRGRARIALLTLSQLLNLKSAADFQIVDFSDDEIIKGDIIDSQTLFNDIADRYPSIEVVKAQVEKSKYDIQAARAGYYPQLKLRASLNTYYQNFFNTSSELSSLSAMTTHRHFPGQMWHNRSELIGLHLTVPVFDHSTTRNNIRRARMSLADNQLLLDDVRQKLHKEIEQAYHNAYNAREKFQSALKAQEASQLSFTFEQDKYDSGRSTLYDLTQATQRLRQARENAVQAKYEFIIREKILAVYAK